MLSERLKIVSTSPLDSQLDAFGIGLEVFVARTVKTDASGIESAGRSVHFRPARRRSMTRRRRSE
jgi:hypothetical protein